MKRQIKITDDWPPASSCDQRGHSARQSNDEQLGKHSTQQVARLVAQKQSIRRHSKHADGGDEKPKSAGFHHGLSDP
eukprot:1394794-Pleurochrysis_carterae.AAC.3